MLFNSIDFALFLPIVFLLYWKVFGRDLRIQNAFLLAASILFYGWWDWRFLGLVFLSSVIDWSVGIALDRTEAPARRKWLLAASMVANLGILGVFKYYDFFITNFNEAFSLMGVPIGMRTLDVVLPVGISFYTFQTMSYSIDVYRRQIEATRDPVAFSAYVLFFPQLVAGPIERASSLMPQFKRERVFVIADAWDGLRQILWGLFKRAPSCSPAGAWSRTSDGPPTEQFVRAHALSRCQASRTPTRRRPSGGSACWDLARPGAERHGSTAPARLSSHPAGGCTACHSGASDR